MVFRYAAVLPRASSDSGNRVPLSLAKALRVARGWEHSGNGVPLCCGFAPRERRGVGGIAEMVFRYAAVLARASGDNGNPLPLCPVLALASTLSPANQKTASA